MADDKKAVALQLSSKINDQLTECAKAEKRTRRAVIELALESYFEKSELYQKHKAEDK